MLQNSAVLVDLNIGVWTGRKMDKKVSNEIDTAKNTKTSAGNYHKKLLAGTQKLDDLQKLVAAIRMWHYEQTLPWSDSGSRLLPMANFFDYKSKLSDYETQFNEGVRDFTAEYSTLVSAAAFQLGDLFNPDDYPDVVKLLAKFRFNFVFSPVAEQGDFRIDSFESTKQELMGQYQKFFDTKLSDAMQDIWDRLRDCLSKMSDKLADAATPRVDKDGNQNFTQIFRDTLVSNALELCGLMSKLNVTNDSKLEQVRQELERTIVGVSADELRDSDELRHRTKRKVDDILSMF